MALKYSRQRQVIKDFLMSRKDHPTADVVYMNVRQEYPNISLGTVYRNLTLLADMGEIQRLRVRLLYPHEEKHGGTAQEHSAVRPGLLRLDPVRGSGGRGCGHPQSQRHLLGHPDPLLPGQGRHRHPRRVLLHPRGCEGGEHRQVRHRCHRAAEQEAYLQAPHQLHGGQGADRGLLSSVSEGGNITND